MRRVASWVLCAATLLAWPVLGRAETGSASWTVEGVVVTTPGEWRLGSEPRELEGFVEGGTLTELLEGAPVKLTPYLSVDAYSYRIINEAVCESLAALDVRTLELRGVLAEAWQYDPAGLWLRVKLRDEATFSDGKPVTGADVRFTFMDYVLNPAIDARAHRGLLESVKDVVVLGDKVVEFRFKEARFSNLSVALRNVILPRHVYNAAAEVVNRSTAMLVGSGPYRLAEAEDGSAWTAPKPIELVRNERYWGARPAIERLRFEIVPDHATRLRQFEAGKGDIMRAMPEQFAARAGDEAFLEQARALTWTNIRSGVAFICWNTGARRGEATLFADARVRRAMTMMLDRGQINRRFLEGLASVATGPFPPTQSDPALEPIAYDPKGARALLTEAGWTDRDGDGVIENAEGRAFRFEFLYPAGGALGEGLAVYLADQAAALGIEVRHRQVDWATLTALRRERDFDAMVMTTSWAEPESDPFQSFHSSQRGPDGGNWCEWSHPKADELIERGRTTLDAALRREIWFELHRLVHEEQPCTYLVNSPWFRFVSKRVQNVHPAAGTWDRREFFISGSSK